MAYKGGIISLLTGLVLGSIGCFLLFGLGGRAAQPEHHKDESLKTVRAVAGTLLPLSAVLFTISIVGERKTDSTKQTNGASGQ